MITGIKIVQFPIMHLNETAIKKHHQSSSYKNRFKKRTRTRNGYLGGPEDLER